MRPRTLVFGALGTLATGLAAVAVFAPGVVETVGPLAGLAATFESVDRRQLLLLASVVVGLFVSAVSWRATGPARGEADAFDEATAGPPESVTSARQRLTAAGIASELDAAVRGSDGASRRVRDRLRETATRAYARSTERSVAEARTAVRNGEWTDDRTAAATLADDGSTHSLWSRLRLWLDPESERRRRFDRTVRATARLAGDDPAGGEPSHARRGPSDRRSDGGEP